MSTQTTERMMYVRTFDAEVTAGDGRTLDVRIVPYNAPAVVADPPSFEPYREAFLAGAFERQVGAPDRVRIWLNFEHDQGLRGIVGHGMSLREASDGLEGSFRVHENADGDKALQLVEEGLLTGVSMEFRALRSRTVGGVVQRVRAHLDKVSLCRTPAYPTAQILAVRQELITDGEITPPDDTPPDEPPPDEPPPDEPPPELRVVDRSASELLDERLAALGVEIITRVATTAKAWDGSAARFTDEQYAKSTLFCRPGDGPVKERCSLPVLEPDGTLNVNALGAAAAALSGGRTPLRNVSLAQKAAAARKLVRLYGQAKQTPPDALVALARQ